MSPQEDRMTPNPTAPDDEPRAPRAAIAVTPSNDPHFPRYRLDGFGLRLSVEAQPMPVVRVNAPALYRDPAFRAWLDHERNAPATWHQRGEAVGEYSDVFVFFGGAAWEADGRFTGDGSHYPADAERPGFTISQYALLARAVELATGSAQTECLVWITNLEADEPDPVEASA